MIYLMTEISLFLVGAFAAGWWLGRRQARDAARARVVDIETPAASAEAAELQGSAAQRGRD